MAETFKNYLRQITTTGNFEVIPYADETNSEKREGNSTVQVHSLYITRVDNDRFSSENRYEESSFNHVDIMIVENDDVANATYVGYDIQLVPGSSYFFEKNITLEPHQSLRVSLPNSVGANNTYHNIHVTASAVLFTPDE